MKVLGKNFKLNNREIDGVESEWTKLRTGDILSFGKANFYTAVLVEPGKTTNLQQRVEVAKRYIYDVQIEMKPPPLPVKQTKKIKIDSDGGTSNEIDQVESLDDDEDVKSDDKHLNPSEPNTTVIDTKFEDEAEIPADPQIPHSMPYLLTIQGSNNMRTYLNQNMLKVGREGCQVNINHSSILLHHATIRYFSTKNQKSSDISIRPAAQEARIKINNKLLSFQDELWKTLVNGDIVSFGDSSYFTCVIVDPISRADRLKKNSVDEEFLIEVEGSSGDEYRVLIKGHFLR